MKVIRFIISFFKWLRSSYFNYPFICDIIFISVIIILDYNYLILSPILHKINLTNLPSNLITGSLTLLGFFITAITIIMSFQGSYKTKEKRDKNDGVGIFFSSKKQYGNLLKIFRSAVWIVFVIFLSLIILEAFGSNFPNKVRTYLIVSCFLLLVTAATRSLYTLHLVINTVSR